MSSTKATNESWTTALIPTLFARDSPSGSIARRAGMGLVPILFFQAGSCPKAERRLLSSPTPIVVLLGGSKIIMVIPLLPASKRFASARSGAHQGIGRRSLALIAILSLTSTTVLSRLDWLE